MSDHKTQFGLIRRATERAIKKARGALESSAVNWADLHCVSVEFWVDDQDGSGYRVLIEEASPNADDFQEFVRRELARDLPDMDVIVQTEW